MKKNIQHIVRVLRTVRYLKPSQLYWFIRRRVIKSQSVAPVLPAVIACRNWRWAEPDDSIDVAVASVSFTFLNVSRSFPLAAIDWAPNDVNRLWRYNLHYFDYLLDEHRSENEKKYLISDWIIKNPLGSEPAWEPYTASLRIVNWVKYLSLHDVGAASSPRIDQLPVAAGRRSYSDALHSLYLQTLWLEQNLELHILANHYFENLKALLFAGVFFQGDDAARWRTYAVEELQKQLREQILPDGCHYERAPQYHAVLLDDVLDMVQLAGLQPELFAPEFVVQLNDVAKRMADFLADILNPLGQYPLFNDSAFYDESPVEILHRAELLVGAASSPRNDEAAPTTSIAGNNVAGMARSCKIIQHHAAGFYGYAAGGDWLMIDCGDIGPAYQPGHTHCDLLSYELVIDGISVVVDTGVLEYEPGAMRHYVRSTAAHNVVQVGDAEQSEIWGEFRVARRARKLRAEIRRKAEGIVFEGVFSGFHALGGIAHKRRVEIGLDNLGASQSWHIKDVIKSTDLIKGAGQQRLRSYIHLHPQIEPVLQDEILSLNYHGKSLARLLVSPAAASKPVISIEETVYCPEFGRADTSHVVIIEMRAELPAQFGYTINKMQ